MNSSSKITNGVNKGLTLKKKHIRDCNEIEQELLEELKEEVSSTEERISKGERRRLLMKKKKIKRCPYRGCNKEYKDGSRQCFRNHLKRCSFRNQKELGNWVIQNSRKYDFDMLEDNS